MPKFVGRINFPCTIELGRGLEGAITNTTQIGYVDGDAGHLSYRGYAIEDLSDHTTFEETAYLLIFGKLPNQQELNDFHAQLASAGEIPGHIVDLIRKLPRDAHPMNALQTALCALGCDDQQAHVVTEHVSDPANALQAETDVAVRIMAHTRNCGAAIGRARRGEAILQPDDSLSFTGNFLYMMTGERPSDVTRRLMDICLILQADHGMNASTFTAMVVHSTLSDMYSTISAAVGSLRGPLHGGANEGALGELISIGKPENVADHVREKIARHEKIMGFGHRVYKAYDPRALVLKKHAKALCKEHDLSDLYETAVALDDQFTAAMKAAGKPIYPNVDFYSGLVYHALGFPTPMFPVIFAVARTAGWAARVLEYLPENRIFRPRAVYNGPTDLKVVPVDRR